MATSLRSSLPKPKYTGPTTGTHVTVDNSNERTLATTGAPPHGRRRGSGWVPRRAEDFGDGGAFPELHVAQYPLNMGREKTSKSLAVEVDGSGNARYDALARQGQGDKIVYSHAKDLVPLRQTLDTDLSRPDDEEVARVAEETRAKLMEKVESSVESQKVAGQIPRHKDESQYIKYTPAYTNESHNSGAKHRVIRMVEQQVDPIAPPKFKNKKVPKGPGSPPVPVMHSPPRKLTVGDQQAWKIPPCISNWKNAKGYTIPLDKRLAADGRGLQQVEISDGFASLSEALYIAERQAREDVEKRAAVQARILAREREEKAARLTNLAAEARRARANPGATRSRAEVDSDSESEERPAKRMRASDRFEGRSPDGGSESGGERGGGGGGGGRARAGSDSGDDDEGRKARDALREDRRRQREREMRLNKRAPTVRNRERDISEKVALGQAQPTRSAEAMYDSRLFNQSEGLSSGFGADDGYNLYDKPLFQDRSETNLYRPRASGEGEDDEGSSRLGKPNRAFSGTGSGNARRNKPIEFEKDEDDPFGLDTFMTSESKRGDKESSSSKFKTKGVMSAAAGSSAAGSGGSGRSKIAFEKERGDDRRRDRDRDSDRSRDRDRRRR